LEGGTNQLTDVMEARSPFSRGVEMDSTLELLQYQEYGGSVWPGWEGSIKNAGGGERRTSVSISLQEPIQRPALTLLETELGSNFCPFCVSALCPGPNSHKKCQH